MSDFELEKRLTLLELKHERLAAEVTAMKNNVDDTHNMTLELRSSMRELVEWTRKQTGCRHHA